jgi:hypothetical protein
VQTFLPYPRFDASAAVLDDLRLGKQRVETLQILRALVWPTYGGWKNHPATAMWRGFTDVLVCYGIAICQEWERRGRADAVRCSLEQFSATPEAGEDELAVRGRMPPWLGTPSFHDSHRASLVAKLPEHYRRYFPEADPSLPSEWPTPLFRRWPVRRLEPLTRVGAAEALGVDPESASASEQAMLEVLQSPGSAVWVHDRPVEPPPPPVEQLRPEVQVRAPGKISPSVARDPSPADHASVEAERTTPPLLQVYRRRSLRERAVQPHLPPEAAVVIAEGVADIRGVRRSFPDARIFRLPAV